MRRIRVVSMGASRDATVGKRMVRASACWTIAVLLSVTVVAQEPTQRFEVASVKQSPDPTTLPVMAPDGGTLHPGGRWLAAFVSLGELIRRAYPGHDFTDQIVGGPSWLATARYHIEARTTAGATAADVPPMLRGLHGATLRRQAVSDQGRNSRCAPPVTRRQPLDDRRSGRAKRRPHPLRTDAFTARGRCFAPACMGAKNDHSEDVRQATQTWP